MESRGPVPDRPELLVYLGRSSTQVRSAYAAAFVEVLDEEEQAACSGVILERWIGLGPQKIAP